MENRLAVRRIRRRPMMAATAPFREESSLQGVCQPGYPSADGDTENDCVGGRSILFPWTPIFEFERLRTAYRRLEFPRFHAAGSRQWATRLISRLTEGDQNRCIGVSLNPSVASRWTALEPENQFLADAKNHSRSRRMGPPTVGLTSYCLESALGDVSPRSRRSCVMLFA